MGDAPYSYKLADGVAVVNTPAEIVSAAMALTVFPSATTRLPSRTLRTGLP